MGLPGFSVVTLEGFRYISAILLGRIQQRSLRFKYFTAPDINIYSVITIIYNLKKYMFSKLNSFFFNALPFLKHYHII